tara:strand:- start:394 stop:846 length:453 start_codon:yes stop_codon:yes gene_type:complete
MAFQDGASLKGQLEIVLKDQSGKVKERRKEKNLIVNTGLNAILDRLVGTSEAVMSHMGLGSSSTAAAAGQTALVSQLGSREAIDSSTVTGSSVAYVCTFEAGDATGTITEAGIFNAASGGTMLCRSVFSSITKGANDSLNVTWTITVTAS